MLKEIVLPITYPLHHNRILQRLHHTKTAPLLVPPSRSNMKEDARELINKIKLELKDESFVGAPLWDGDLTPLLCLSDLHFGEFIKEDEEVLFDLKIAEKNFLSIIRQACEVPEYKGYQVDEIVVLLAGDIIDGELIYPAQSHRTVGDAYTQIKSAVQIIWKGLLLLTERFNHVTVYCVAGNHGRASRYHSPMSNWDNALYLALNLMAQTWNEDKALTAPRIDVVTPDALWMNFQVRGWNVHARHIGVTQASSSGPLKKLLTWILKHQADLVFYGHFHNPEMYSVGDVRVFKNGALPPANDFSEMHGFIESSGQWLVGISDSSSVEFTKIIRPKE